MSGLQIIDELRVCLETEDGRTLIAMREAEPHYDVVIESAEYHGDGTSVTSDGLTTYLTGREVKVGDVVTYWDGNASLMMGAMRHGWALNGELVQWKTPLERIAERVQGLAEHDRRQRERLEKGAERRQNDYEGLPAPLKARIDRFVSEKPDFWLNGDYELFCCTEAVKIAEYVRPKVDAGTTPEDAIREFYDAPVGVQREAGVDEGHSGNTFGGACSLARALLEGVAV